MFSILSLRFVFRRAPLRATAVWVFFSLEGFSIRPPQIVCDAEKPECSSASALACQSVAVESGKESNTSASISVGHGNTSINSDFGSEEVRGVRVEPADVEAAVLAADGVAAAAVLLDPARQVGIRFAIVEVNQMCGALLLQFFSCEYSVEKLRCVGARRVCGGRC